MTTKTKEQPPDQKQKHSAGRPRNKPPGPEIPDSIATVPCGGGTVAEHPGLPGVTVELVLADRDLANQALACNVNNRPEKSRVEAALRRDVEHDDFLYNGSTWVFNWLGEMDDGQHRAWVIAETGIPLWVTIVRGTDPLAWYTIDSNAVRRAADELAREGVANPGTTAAVAKLMHVQITSPGERGKAGSSKTQATTSEILATIKTHPELIEAAAFACDAAKDPRRPVKMNRVAFAAAYWLFTMRDAETGRWFMERVVDGEGIGGGSPGSQILAFRARLSRQADTGGELLNQPTQLWFLARTWRAFQAGEEVERLMRPKGGYKGEFPEIVAASGLVAIPNGKEPRDVPVPAFSGG